MRDDSTDGIPRVVGLSSLPDLPADPIAVVEAWRRVIGGREWKDLLGGVLDALRIFPPAYASSIFGLPWTWLPPHDRYSDFRVIDVWRPLRTLTYLTDVLIPPMPRTPPPFVPPFLQRLFWHPTVVLQRGDHNGSFTSHPDEAWFFVNGIMTNDALAHLNAAYLADLFHRPITLIQNSTGGLADDLLECALDKAWGHTGEAAARTFPAVYDALKDPSKDRVVLIAHSQGTIIAGVVLRIIRALNDGKPSESVLSALVPELVSAVDEPLDLADFDPLEPEEIDKLEIYCFGNCATEMPYAIEGKQIPWIESYGNEFDIVARLGVLAPNADEREVQIDGPKYVRKGAWGHLLNEHYLRPIEQVQRKGHKRGPATPTADPYIPLDGNAPDEVPRLYHYLNGGRPPTGPVAAG